VNQVQELDRVLDEEQVRAITFKGRFPPQTRQENRFGIFGTAVSGDGSLIAVTSLGE
jgi:hypothetical protein